MPIYKNSVVVAENTVEDIKINETYTDNSFGRILYEIELNDMAFFEAVMRHDMQELHSLSEGTLLEAEVEAANAEARKSLFKRMADFIKKCGEKIMAAIKAAINKLQEYVNNATLVADFKKSAKDFKGTVKVQTCSYLDYKFKNVDLSSGVNAGFASMEGDLAGIFKSICGSKYAADSVEDFKKIAYEEHMKTTTFTDGEVSNLAGIYKENSKAISELNKFLKAYEATFKRLDSELMHKASTATSNYMGKKLGEDAKNEFDTMVDAQMKGMRLLMTAYTAVADAQITMCKVCLGSVKNAMYKVSHTKLEE